MSARYRSKRMVDGQKCGLMWFYIVSRPFLLESSRKQLPSVLCRQGNRLDLCSHGVSSMSLWGLSFDLQSSPFAKDLLLGLPWSPRGWTDLAGTGKICPNVRLSSALSLLAREAGVLGMQIRMTNSVTIRAMIAIH